MATPGRAERAGGKRTDSPVTAAPTTVTRARLEILMTGTPLTGKGVRGREVRAWEGAA
jgi:hypothetical protein